MVSIPFKEILSSPLQNLSSVGISTLELPVILSFPAGSVWNCCYQPGCTSTLTWPLCFLELVSPKASPVLLSSLCWAAASRSAFIPLHQQHSALTWAVPFSCVSSSLHSWFGLFGALQTRPQGQDSSGSSKELVGWVLLGQGTLQNGWTGSEMFCRKRVTEVFHRATAGSLTHHPHFGSVLAFLSLLGIWNCFVYLLFSFIINLPLTLLSTSVFQSSFLCLFDYGLNLDQRKMRPQDKYVRCTDQCRFLDMGSFGSSETEVAAQSSWMCFRDHQSGEEFRCTFPGGFAGVGLMPGWVHVELSLKRGKTEGIIFCHPNNIFFPRGYKIL